MDASVDRSIVDDFAADIVFIAFMREQECAPETGIEGFSCFFVIEFGIDAVKMFFPYGIVLHFDIIESRRTDFSVDNRFRDFIGYIRRTNGVFDIGLCECNVDIGSVGIVFAYHRVFEINTAVLETKNEIHFEILRYVL